MTDVAQVALQLSLAVAIFSALASLLGAWRRQPELIASARNATLALLVLVTISAIGLLYALLTHDFSIRYVAEYSSREQDLFYTLSSFYAGNAGSLLLWAWVLSIFAAIVVFQNYKRNAELWPYANTVLMATGAFFLGLVALAANPLERLAVAPPDGRGLNPLLQNPGMFFHPPTLYLGYVGFVVPFAFAMAALATGQLGDRWIRLTRRWTLFAWVFLTLGNLLGAQWAYVELGWGGYWAWDPVENASFMPWLTGTAFLHSVMIQQRRGMLKVWNMVLIIVTFVLTIFGTFLTRSGILSSVHSFGESTLGPLFFAFMGITLLISFFLLLDRLPQLRSENELDSFLSRESSFLLNNLILLGAAFATFWGTIFPLISEAVRGVKIAVGPPFFNQVNGPIFIMLILLMGICPLIGWRRASRGNLVRNFLYPLIIGAVSAILLFWLGLRQGFALLGFSLSIFVLATILLELFRGSVARHRTAKENYLVALANLIRLNKPRYGGYIIHIGIILMVIGIIGSQFYTQSKEATLSKGESMSIGTYTLTFEAFSSFPTASKTVNAATLSVTNGDEPVGQLVPQKNQHQGWPESHTEVAIRTTLKEDLYVILATFTPDTATFKVLINPLVVWIWIGGGVLVLGTVVAFWPDAREKRRQAARMMREEETHDS
jgi:cytochrome c-type biogenesis protein CcmF